MKNDNEKKKIHSLTSKQIIILILLKFQILERTTK